MVGALQSLERSNGNLLEVGLMRLGLAGVGRIGAFHVSTLAAVPDVTGVVLADADPARVREVAARLGLESVGPVDACERSRRERRPVEVAQVRR